MCLVYRQEGLTDGVKAETEFLLDVCFELLDLFGDLLRLQRSRYRCAAERASVSDISLGHANALRSHGAATSRSINRLVLGAR